MNSVQWFRGKTLKRFLESSGRFGQALDIDELAVVMTLVAQEQGISMEKIVKRLIEADEYMPPPTDREKIMKELGY